MIDHLLRINPNDNQGVRYLALTWNAVLGNWSKVEEILERYRGEAAAEYVYTKCLSAYRTGRGADEAFAEAYAANRFVPTLLQKPGPPSRRDRRVCGLWLRSKRLSPMSGATG